MVQSYGVFSKKGLNSVCTLHGCHTVFMNSVYSLAHCMVQSNGVCSEWGLNSVSTLHDCHTVLMSAACSLLAHCIVQSNGVPNEQRLTQRQWGSSSGTPVVSQERGAAL